MIDSFMKEIKGMVIEDVVVEEQVQEVLVVVNPIKPTSLPPKDGNGRI